MYKKDDEGKGHGWWYFHIGPWEEIVNRGNFLHNCNTFFLFLRTTSEEPDILSYCSRTTANKLSHNFGNISERRGIMESYRLLHWWSCESQGWDNYITKASSLGKMTQKTSYPMLYYYKFEVFNLQKKATLIKDCKPKCHTFELKRWRPHYHTLCFLVLFCRLSIQLNHFRCSLWPIWAMYSFLLWNF